MKKLIISALMAGTVISISAMDQKALGALNELKPLVSKLNLSDLNSVKADAEKLAEQFRGIAEVLNNHKNTIAQVVSIIDAKDYAKLPGVAGQLKQILADLANAAKKINFDVVIKSGESLVQNLREIVAPLLNEQTLSALVAAAQAAGLNLNEIQQYKPQLIKLGEALKQIKL